MNKFQKRKFAVNFYRQSRFLKIWNNWMRDYCRERIIEMTMKLISSRLAKKGIIRIEILIKGLNYQNMNNSIESWAFRIKIRIRTNFSKIWTKIKILLDPIQSKDPEENTCGELESLNKMKTIRDLNGGQKANKYPKNNKMKLNKFRKIKKIQ